MIFFKSSDCFPASFLSCVEICGHSGKDPVSYYVVWFTYFSLHSQHCQQPLPLCCLLQRYFHFILWITLSNWNCSVRKVCPFYPCPLTFELLTYTLWTPGYAIIQPFHDLFCSSKGSAFELFRVGCYRKGRPWCPGVTNGLMLVNG